MTERSDSGGMSFLDDEEYEKGGIEMNAAARAALMQKLSQTHSAGTQQRSLRYYSVPYALITERTSMPFA